MVSGYEISEWLGETAHARLGRGHRVPEGASVLVKRLDVEIVPPGLKERLKREFEVFEALAGRQGILAASRRAQGLTRQLLAFGRKQILQPQIINVNDILARVEKMLRRLIGEDVELTFNLAENLGKVRVDPNQFEQVVMNLAVNSRDAMPSGGELTIEIGNVVLDEKCAAEHAGAVPGPHVMLAVTDTGVGMDQATQARMFEPFFTTKEKGKGILRPSATLRGATPLMLPATRPGRRLPPPQHPCRLQVPSAHFPRSKRSCSDRLIGLAARSAVFPETLRSTMRVLVWVK
jgi:signal transduction histidine kinase